MSAKKSKFQGLFGDEPIVAEPVLPQPQAPAPPAAIEEETKKPREEEAKKTRNQENNADSITRVKTNYEIREDYVRAFKVMAADERRKIYQLLEEAMQDFLVKRGKISPD